MPIDDFKISSDELNDLLDTAIQMVQERMDSGVKVIEPLVGVFAQDAGSGDRGTAFYAIEIDNNQLEVMRALGGAVILEDRLPLGVVMISEGWVSAGSGARTEVLMIAGLDVSMEERVGRISAIVRDEDGNLQWGETLFDRRAGQLVDGGQFPFELLKAFYQGVAMAGAMVEMDMKDGGGQEP